MTETHPIQRLAYLGTIVLGAIVAVSALPGLWITVLGYEKWGLGPQFLIAGFEAMTLAAGITAALMGLRRRSEGYGLGILCVAGTIFVGALLGAKMLQSTSEQVPSLMGFVKFRLALMVGLVALAGLVKLGVRPDCWRKLMLGGALLLPAAAIAGLVVTRKTGYLTNPIRQLHEIAQMVVWLALAIVLGILTIAGGHFVIRAFELTREPKSEAADSE